MKWEGNKIGIVRKSILKVIEAESEKKHKNSHCEQVWIGKFQK